MVMNVRDQSNWSLGLARELSGPIPVFPVALFVDNAAALSTLLNGSTSVIQGVILIDATRTIYSVCWVSKGFNVGKINRAFPVTAGWS